MKRAFVMAGALALAALGLSTQANAEEGMWTFDNVPASSIQRAYGFTPDQAWLDRVRLGAVRLTSGCSASLVSAEGLVQTNHHCVVSCLQNFSSEGNDTLAAGYAARTRADERQCPGVRAQTLLSMTDVTSQIATAAAGVSGAGFAAARDREIARLESECKAGREDRVCEVVTLYQGGQYQLYAYKQYSDVRMVFAPEQQIAFFGGDPDNFNFPRYAFDVSYLRVYENGQPAATPNRLRWRSTPLTDGELTFVAGHPGTTSRLLTTAQLAFQRDHFLPWRLATLSELRGRLIAFGAQGPEQRRIIADQLFGVENSYKAMTGRRLALVDPTGFGQVETAQEALQTRIRRNRAMMTMVGDAYGEIERAAAAQRSFYLAHQYLEARAGGGSSLFNSARTIVRAAADRQKPDGERLRPYTEARLAATQGALVAPFAVEPELEEILLSFWLEKMREYLTADHPLVRDVLGRESPEALAHQLVTGTRLADPAARRALWEGGAAAVAASNDPMIQFVARWDQAARDLGIRFRTEVEGPVARAQERISRARFQLMGTSTYPDATFTLRLSYGAVRGWSDPDGREVAPFTTTSGLWDRATAAYPFNLPATWTAARSRLDPNTIFNLSSTQDIIGGNSGSPLLDRDGAVVGAVFDGNIHSLGGEYFYDGRLNRTVTVASTIVEEALVDVYGMQSIVDELKR
ncbi:MAG: S46 family peptidase [Caulobacterales bacterium]